MRTRRLYQLAAVAVFAAAPAQAQRDDAAVQLLDAAIKAHQPAGRPLEAQLRYVGEGPQPTQGLRALGPFENYVLGRTVTVDEAKRSSAAHASGAIAGLDFEQTTINTPAFGVAIDKLNNSYTEARTPPGFLATSLPHSRLRTIRDTATAIQMETAAGQPRLRFRLPNGGSGTLTFDPTTKLVSRHDFPPVAGIYGEDRTSIIYSSYRDVNGTAVPEAYVLRTENPVFGVQETTIRLASARPSAPAEAFARPEGLKPADYSWRKAPFEVTTLAPDVHLINNITDSKDQWSYNVLAVVFEDHVMVAEAPISAEANERVLAEIAKLAPGKPVRHLVLSHHHNDHIAGIEPYMKRGVSMLVTGEGAKLIRRIAERRGAAFGTPRLDIVQGRREFRDSRNEVHIHDMGANPHAHQMLVVHLPRQGIVYQVDFVNDGEYPANANTKSFLDWIERRKLRVNTIAGVHGRLVRYPVAAAN